MKINRFLIVSVTAASIVIGCTQSDQQILPQVDGSATDLVEKYQEVIKKIDVAPVWSAHKIGRPELFTSDEFQYLKQTWLFFTFAQGLAGNRECGICGEIRSDYSRLDYQ